VPVDEVIVYVCGTSVVSFVCSHALVIRLYVLGSE
jgi:hypothetical protein